MERTNQKVNYVINNDNYGIFQRQTITKVIVDDEQYAYGTWKGKLVASFHIDNGEWFVM